MLQLVAWAAAARVEGGGAVLEVEGAVAAPEKWPMLNVRRCVMVLTTMERACARNVGGVVEGCE